ncbi:MAG: threonine/serine dehydratase [Thermoflexales bacterium]
MSGAPTPDQVREARRVLLGRLPPTPLIHAPSLSAQTGADVWLKCECFAPIGSFKARGALMGVLRLAPEQLRRGLICASTGNHGAAMAWAATQVGARCVVVVPHNTPDIKRRNMRAAGGEVITEGGDWGESCLVAREVAARDGLLYLEDGEDPWIMAGAGTVALEILDQLPTIDTLVIPVGGGNLIAGCGIAIQEAGQAITLIGVQSEAAPAVTESFRLGQIVCRPTTSFAGGVATTGPAPKAFEVMKRLVDDMLLVSEDELMNAIGRLIDEHAIIVEGAGAAPIAALLRYPERFSGRRVALLLSGRNLERARVEAALRS